MSLTLLVSIAAFIGVAALVGGVSLLLRGGGDSTAEDRLGTLTGKSSARGKRIEKEATVIAKPLNEVPNMLEDLASRVLNLSLFLEQANFPLSPTNFLVVTAVLFGVGVAAIVVAGLPVAFAPLAGVTLAAIPFGSAYFLRNRRKKQFGRQLPEALELVARALRAGHSLASGFHLVASEMADPIASEFGRCYEEQNLGIPMDEALDSLASRVPNLDLRFFATAVILQRQTGGDLAEILDKIGHLIRERFKIWGQVQALTGEGRLSGIVLLALPPALFVVMLKMNYDYVMLLFQDPMGKKMLMFAIVLQLIGAIVIKKIVNIKV
jgi:tight adherence protein B